MVMPYNTRDETLGRTLGVTYVRSRPRLFAGQATRQLVGALRFCCLVAGFPVSCPFHLPPVWLGLLCTAHSPAPRQVLTEVTSSCVVTQLLEVLLIRLGLYLINSPAVVLDLIAYTGYK